MGRFLISELAAGDLRTIGSANAVVERALVESEIVDELVDALSIDHPGLRLRAADVLEKVSLVNPELLQRFLPEFLRLASTCSQKEVQWHMGLILPRLQLDAAERDEVEGILDGYLRSETSAIVRVSAVEGFARLALAFPEMRDRCMDRILGAMEVGPPSVVARGRRMLKLLAKVEG